MSYTHSQCRQEMRDLDSDDVLTYHMTMTACMESGTTQIWNRRKDFVWIFVDRNLMRSCFCWKAEIFAFQVGDGKLASASCRRGEVRWSCNGRQTAFHRSFSPIGEPRSLEIIRNLQRMKICCSCAQELEGTAEPGLMLYGPAVAFLKTMSEMEVAWVRAKVELVGISWIPKSHEKVVLSWSWTKIWELLRLEMFILPLIWQTFLRWVLAHEPCSGSMHFF